MLVTYAYKHMHTLYFILPFSQPQFSSYTGNDAIQALLRVWTNALFWFEVRLQQVKNLN